MKIKLTNVIGSYVALLEPREDLSGSECYSMQAIISAGDDEQIGNLQRKVIEVAKEKFGSKAEAMLKSGKLKSPLRFADGDAPDYTQNPPYAGNWFLTLKTKAEYSQPKVVGKNPREVITSTDDCYSGCTFNVIGTLYAYDNSGNRGVAVALKGAQVVHKGERLDGGIDPAQEFDFIDGGSDDDEFFENVA